MAEIELDTTNYDSKHINNLAPDKNIPDYAIENLRKQGFTIENIEKLISEGFPVCKYKTQITVHGNCPEIKNNYVGYYSCLVKNKNNSLGIKWNGIDTAKKERIHDLRYSHYNRRNLIQIGDYKLDNYWKFHQDSTETYIFNYVDVPNPDNRYFLSDDDRKVIKDIAEKISQKIKGLFFGYITTKGKAIKITILGIYEKNFDKFVNAVFDYSVAEIEEQDKDFKEMQEFSFKKAEKLSNEYMEQWKAEHPMPENFEPINRYPVNGDVVCCYWFSSNGIRHNEQGLWQFNEEDCDIRIVYYKFYKSWGKLCYKDCLPNGDFKNEYGRGIEFIGSYPKDWYIRKSAVVVKPQPTPGPQKDTPKPTDKIKDENLKAIRNIIIQNEHFKEDIRFNCYSPKIEIILFKPKYPPSENFRQDLEIEILQYKIGSVVQEVKRRETFLNRCSEIAKYYTNIASFDTKLEDVNYFVRLTIRFKKECLFSEIADIFVSCVKEFDRGNINANLTVDDDLMDYNQNTSTSTSSNVVSKVALQIVDYSKKAIVSTGDTKPIKDEIKALGGKFGSYFDKSKVPSGIGWLFPKTKLADVEKLVAKYSTETPSETVDKSLQILELKYMDNNSLDGIKTPKKILELPKSPLPLQGIPKKYLYAVGSIIRYIDCFDGTCYIVTNITPKGYVVSQLGMPIKNSNVIPFENEKDLKLCNLQLLELLLCA